MLSSFGHRGRNLISMFSIFQESGDVASSLVVNVTKNHDSTFILQSSKAAVVALSQAQCSSLSLPGIAGVTRLRRSVIFRHNFPKDMLSKANPLSPSIETGIANAGQSF